MDHNVVECEVAERDPGLCVCKGGPTLAILKDVQKLYEDRMELIDRVGGSNKMQLQVDVLRSWVGDLVGQNTLLARAVEELEAEATTKLLVEKRRHSELVCEVRAECAALRRRLARKDSDLRGLVEVLRRLREFDYCTLDGIHFFEVTESDIFGSVEWRQKKLEEGDFKRHMKHDTYRVKSNRYFKDLDTKTCNKVKDLKIANESLHKENLAKDKEIRQLNKDIQQYEQTIMNLRNEMSLTKYHTPDVSKKDAEVMAGMCCTGAECGDCEPVKDYSETLHTDALKCQQRVQKMETNLKSSSESVRALRKVNAGLAEEAHAMRRVCAALHEQCRAANLRAQFKDDIIREMRNQLKQAKAKASTSYHVATSTPNVSCACEAEVEVDARSLDASLIVMEQPDPILTIPDESIEDLAESFRKQCTCRSKPSSSKQQDTPSAAGSQLVTEQACKGGVHELYFNNDVKKSDSSMKQLFYSRVHMRESLESLKQYLNGLQPNDPSDVPNVKAEPSATLTKTERETMNRSCDKIVNDSGGACSLAGSASGSCDAARAQYYHNKLLATLQILQNKEETIRVQAESLAMAEARISALTARSADLRKELDMKTKELNSLRKAVENCKIEKTDVSVMADRQEVENQTDVVITLQNNLSVIEDLYRECFYETAKQEDLIDMLRKSYLDVRLMDKQKADHIGRLETVISSQKLSLDRCQDLAMEVDTLKMEISNFLNNSTNNDSGMWEIRSETQAGGGVQDDLQDIMEQLLRLRETLATGCICGLQEENIRLKQSNETMEVKIGELRHNIRELESELLNKDHTDTRYKEEIEEKEKELLEIRRQLVAVEESSRDQSTACDTITMQLQQAQVLLNEKAAELNQVRQQYEAQESTIQELRRELERADNINEEKSACGLAARLAGSERRARSLAAELQRARAHCDHVDACYREQASCAAELQAQLGAAQARGAALCEEARRAVAAVRAWARRMRRTHRDQENMIKEKETLLNILQQRLEERQNNKQRTSASENGPSCSKCSSSRNRSESNDSPRCCPNVEKRRMCCGTSESEVASCSSAPVPPRRMLRKKPMHECNRCGCRSLEGGSPPPPSPPPPPACCREPRRVRVRLQPKPRDISPTEELFLRVEQLSEALADSQKRWTRTRDDR